MYYKIRCGLLDHSSSSGLRRLSGGVVLLPMVGNGGLMYAQPQPQDMTTLLNIIRGHGKGRPSGGPNCRRANAAYAQSMG